MSTAVPGPSMPIPYWELKQRSRELAESREHSDRALEIHRELGKQARQRGHARDEHDAWLRASRLFSARGKKRDAYKAARLACQAYETCEARGRELATGRAVAGLDVLAASAEALATRGLGSDDAMEANRKLLRAAKKASDDDLAAKARASLANAWEYRGEARTAQLIWRQVAATAPSDGLKQNAEAQALRVVRECREYSDARLASDGVVARETSGDDDVEAHRRFYDVARSFDDLSMAALGADRLCAMHLTRGQFSEVLTWAREAHSTEPTAERDAQLSRARNDVALFGELLPALAELRDLGAYLRVGKEYRSQGKRETARVIYLAGRDRFPETPTLLNALAGVFREIPLIDLAHAHVVQSLKLDGALRTNRAAHTIRGYMLCDQGRYEDALSVGRSLHVLHPKDPYIHQLCARAYIMLDDRDHAIEHAVLADKHGDGGTDVVAWLCDLRTAERERGSLERLRAIDTVIDHVKRLRGEPIWEGSLASSPAAG